MSHHSLRASIITLSMRVSRGERPDAGGNAIAKLLQSHSYTIVSRTVLPDDKVKLVDELIHLCDSRQTDLILTTGGTGISPTDCTPEATLEVIDKRLPGFEMAMMHAGLQKTPYAMLSRAVAGTRNKTLIINLPGNPKGAVENLQAVIRTIPHAIRVLQAEQVADAEHQSSHPS